MDSYPYLSIASHSLHPVFQGFWAVTFARIYENINLFALMSSYLFFLTFVYFCGIIPFIHVCVIFPSSLNPFSLWWIYSPFDEIWILKRLIGHLPFWLTFAPPMQFWKRQSAVKGVKEWTITGNHKQKRNTELEMTPGFISLSSPCKNLTEIWAISPRLFFVKMLKVLQFVPVRPGPLSTSVLFAYMRKRNSVSRLFETENWEKQTV